MGTLNTSEYISIKDRGLHYGDGLFETIAIKVGKALFVNEHLTRLKQDCLRLHITQPDFAELTEEINTKAKKIKKGIIKIIVSRGCGGRGYQFDKNMQATVVLLSYDWPEYPKQLIQSGINLYLCHTQLAQQPLLAGIKHLNRLENVLARFEWQGQDYAEGLMCDFSGNVIEGTMSNVFIVSKNILITPDLSNCGVAGIMRQLIINIANTIGIDIIIKNISLQDLYSAQELFISNSIINIWPVAQFQNTYYKDYTIAKKLGKIITEMEML